VRFNKLWFLLICLAGVFAVLYLWYSLFPGKINNESLYYFNKDEILRARYYILPCRLVSVSSFILELGFWLWIIFSPRGQSLVVTIQNAAGGGVWGARISFFLFLWLALKLLYLPFSLFAGYYWEKSWGFLTQSLASWWQDYFLGAGIDFVFTLVSVIVLFLIIDRCPRKWWLVGALLTSGWLFVQVFLWPIVISPLFNDFQTAKDPEIIQMVKELSDKAGIKIDQVLIMDASRRTTSANAYFTGLGNTKRIVLYDTLLKDYPRDEVRAVIAHEMAHWKHKHVLKGLLWGTAANILLWWLLFGLLQKTLIRTSTYPPYTWALVLLFLLLVSFIGNPVENYMSRRMEIEADKTAVAMTSDKQAAVRLQIDLAAKNLADVFPPSFIEWFSYSHPSALKRIYYVDDEIKKR
jgi:STE24 endopeptidase